MLLIALILLSGCHFILSPGGSGNAGSLTLNFGGSGGGSPSALAINHGGELLPEMLAALNYQVTLAGPDNETLNHTLAAGESLTVSLALGSWRIDVSAYYQGGTLIEKGALIGTGSTTVPIKPGNNTARINMNMAGPLYKIHIPELTGGTVVPNFSYAFAGTPVTLTVTPINAGAAYKANSLKVNEGTVGLTVSGTTGTFTMPLADVEVTAEFLNGWRYVTANGTGDGSSWANASDDLQKMMDEAAAAKDYGVPEALVRVAAGTYKPRYKPNSEDGTSNYDTPANDRDATFMLREGVEIRGGYPAAGGDDASRNSATNNTTLSGDIGTPNDDSDNVYHVVLGVGASIDRRTVLNGFTVTGGNASAVNNSFTIGSTPIERIKGGGIYLDSASPVLTNVVITGNRTIGNASYPGTGGGVYIKSASPVLNNVSITENTAEGASSNGGGIYLDFASPILTYVNITGNESTDSDGGGMSIQNHSSPVLINVQIQGNKTAYGGGGIITGSSSSVLINVIITGNVADNGDGGGIYFGSSDSSHYNKLTNGTIAGNYAQYNGGALHAEAASLLDIRNSVIWGNRKSSALTSNGIHESDGAVTIITSSIVQDKSTYPSDGTSNDDGNMNIDPLFTTLTQASPDNPATGGNYRLNSSSPAINKADNDDYPDTWEKWAYLFNNGDIEHPITSDDYAAYVQPALSKDADGNPRLNGTIDMGAYEF